MSLQPQKWLLYLLAISETILSLLPFTLARKGAELPFSAMSPPSSTSLSLFFQTPVLQGSHSLKSTLHGLASILLGVTSAFLLIYPI